MYDRTRFHGLSQRSLVVVTDMGENLLLLWKLRQFKALRRRAWIKFHDSVYLQCRKLQTKRRKKSFPAAAKRHKCFAARIEGITWQAPLQRNADETKPKCSLIVAVLVTLAARNFSSNKIGLIQSYVCTRRFGTHIVMCKHLAHWTNPPVIYNGTVHFCKHLTNLLRIPTQLTRSKRCTHIISASLPYCHQRESPD